MSATQPSLNLPQHPLPAMPQRLPDSHKGLFGHALIVSGRSGMLGATLIAGQACLRSGAGLTTLAVPGSAQIPVNMTLPCAMTIGLPELHNSNVGDRCDQDPHDEAIAAASNSNCSDWLEVLGQPKFCHATLAIGPGLGRHPTTDALVLHTWQHWNNSAVFDADALNAMAEHLLASPSLSEEKSADLSHHIAPRIITPHPGEWERITGINRNDRAAQSEAARRFAAQWNVIVVLKGSKTLVTNGRSEYINTTGNPSMAVGGSGDCLTGIITALLCQGLAPMEAAIIGVYVHGLAGDMANEQIGAPSTLPTDLIAFLPNAFAHLKETHAKCSRDTNTPFTDCLPP